MPDVSLVPMFLALALFVFFLALVFKLHVGLPGSRDRHLSPGLHVGLAAADQGAPMSSAGDTTASHPKRPTPATGPLNRTAACMQ